MSETREVGPCHIPGTVRATDGEVLRVPEGWALLEPGDAALTRRVKADGAHWLVKEKRGRRTFSRGVWAPEETIARHRRRLERERSSPTYTRKLEAGRQRRAKEQEAYVRQFRATVLEFLAFHPRHRELAGRMATAIAEHATPVGSGTVARTQRIPVGERAEAAVIAWMRHQTTAYDHLVIPREKGARREVRRRLARASRRLLGTYRRGESPEGCPLQAALTDSEAAR